jgi:DNA polymerase III alpha subunit
MAVFMLEAEDGKVEAVVYPKPSEVRPSPGADAMVLVRGKYERDEETSKLVVAEITPLEVIRERAVGSGDHAVRQGTGQGSDAQVAAVPRAPSRGSRVSFVVRVNGAVRPCACARPRPDASSQPIISCGIEAVWSGSVLLK